MRLAAVRLSDTGYRWLTFNDPIHLDAIGRITKRPERRPAHRHDRSIKAMTEARRAQSVIPHADRPGIAREYLDTDVTYREIGDRYDVHGEWIRQIVVEHDPSIPRRRRQRQQREESARASAQAWKTLWNRCRLALAEDRRCKACGGWILRNKGTVTCSHECAEAYLVLRIFDDPDHHRRARAKVYLAKPEKYSEVNLEWARRMLGSNPPPRNRTYLVPGSERAEIIKKYRPELYDELVSA